MRFSLRKCIALSACPCLILLFSCEKHHVGEMPEVQREQVDVASESNETSTSPEESSPTPSPFATPTPAEFFPESTPP
jgi:hypothetical protein